MAARLTVDKYPDANVRVVNNPIAEEDPDNRRFLRDVQQWIGIEIESAINAKYPAGSAVEVWSERKYMSGVAGAPCTVELKKRARQAWEAENSVDWHVLGFTADERDRFERFRLGERENVLPVLIDAGMTKSDCYMALQAAGIRIPDVYRRGYPNANCLGCVKATSSTYWNHVRKADPDVFAARAKQSREIGARLVRVRGERVFLDELKPTDLGLPMKNLDFECGIFCEERA